MSPNAPLCEHLSAGLRIVSLFWGDPHSYVDTEHRSSDAGAENRSLAGAAAVANARRATSRPGRSTNRT